MSEDSTQQTVPVVDEPTYPLWGTVLPDQADLDAVDILDAFSAHQVFAQLISHCSQVDAMLVVLAMDRKSQEARRTKIGPDVTDEELLERYGKTGDELADEAERGYDVSKMRERKPR